MKDRATAPRMLLLLFLLAGVAGMHTIGHPAGGGHRSSGHTAGYSTSPISALAAEPARSGDGSVDASRHVMVMDPLNVCLAVLAGGTLLLLAAALGRLRRADPVDHHIATVSGESGRGPPRLRRVGLTIADLSVQRT